MYETFKNFSFFNFCRKNHHQNPHRYVFEFFLYTKSISRYYRNYRLFIRYSCYQSKNFTFFFRFFNSFSPQLTSRNFTFFNHFSHSPDPDPPSLSVAGKTSKSAKILPMGISTKTRKTRLSIVKRFLPKFSKKHVPMGILTKIFKNLLGV